MLTLGASAYAAGRLVEAVEAYRQAERRFPGDFRAPYSLAVIDIRQGRLAPARERLLKVARRAPGNFGAWHNLGYVSQSLGLWPEAADAYRRALEIKTDAAETAFDLAIACSVLGRMDEAFAIYRTLALAPETRARALSRLAILAPERITDDDLRALTDAIEGADAEVEAGLQFAMAGVLDARGATDAAFAAYSAGNALKHRLLSRSLVLSERPAAAAKAHQEAADHVKATFTAAFLSQHAARGEASKAAPIFIVGMPRSGSSLIEQILSAHPRVQGMGESACLADVVNAPSDPANSPSDRARFRGLADDYLSRLRARGWSSGLRPVDKTLENYLHVGLIHLMFPHAVILHSVRDPIDTCLSCYRQLFAVGNETLYDLSEIGAEYVRYRSLMDHWREVLPGRVIEVDHEALVSDLDAGARRLVTDSCGLDWDPACLRFHEAPSLVRTASAAQVRRPIFKTSIQRWRKYERHLGPLFAALGVQAPADRGARR